MPRELTFLPDPERTRDLVYSEHNSCDRSIHVLLQEGAVSHRGFLLRAYRDVVSEYITFSQPATPVVFLKRLLDRLEATARSAGVSASELKQLGVFVLVRSTDGAYLMTTRDEGVLVHSYGPGTGTLLKMSDEAVEGVERLWLDKADLQEELFPETPRDGFMTFRFDPVDFRGDSIVLGCGEEERGTVLELLEDASVWGGPGERGRVSSKFLRNKIMVVGEPLFAVTSARRPTPVRARGEGSVGQKVAKRLAPAAAAVVLVAAGIWWMFGGGWVEREQSAGGAARVPEAPVTEMTISRETVTDTLESLRLVEEWAVTFGEPVTSSPTVAEGAVIFGCRDGHVYGLDARTGSKKWEVGSTQGFGASPSLDGDQVVIADYGGTVYAINVVDGRVNWSSQLPARVVSSPSVLDGRVAVGCFDGYVYCLAVEDGSLAWKRKTGGRIRGAIVSAGEVFFVPSYDGYLYAIAQADGSVRWRYEVGGNVSGSPATDGDVVSVGALDGTIYCLSVADGSVRWTFRTGGAVKSSPHMQGGRLYVGSNDKNVYCLNVADGSQVWKYETGDIVLARPHTEDNRVFVGSYDGFVYCLDRISGELIDRFAASGPVYSSPKGAENRVYLGDNKGRFMCLRFDKSEAS